jgi:hypothetical protein
MLAALMTLTQQLERLMEFLVSTSLAKDLVEFSTQIIRLIL